MDHEERRPLVFPKETYKRGHGIHRWELTSGEKIAGLSAQTWHDYINLLTKITDNDKIVVSPELMTFTGQPLREVVDSKDEIFNRVDEILKYSNKHPNTLFLLGTPTFEGSIKPRNSVLCIRNGKTVENTNKRSGTTDAERNNFSFNAEEPANLVPETNLGLLICSDLATASISLTSETGSEKRVLKLAGKGNLIGKNPTLVHPKAKGLLVPSCWGVGGNRGWIGEENPDEYYRKQLRNITHHVFNRHSNLDEVLVVDRIPLMEKELQPLTPTKPYNALLQRK